MDWASLYDEAMRRPDSAAGYYNRNVGVASPEGRVNVRIPLAAADVMDLRLWSEEEVLAAVQPHVDRVPLLLFASERPRFQIHGFIDGDLLDGFSPRGSRVPAHVLTDVVTLMHQMALMPQDKTPRVPATWPASGDSVEFGRRLAGLTSDVHMRYMDDYRELFSGLGIPEDPLGVIDSCWEALTPRPFAMLHADLHRKNMIVSSGGTWFIDWELALWGDPVYEMAIHLHKMDYSDDQREMVLRLWRESLPAESVAGHENDVFLYLWHERIKSAVVDTVRYSKIVAAEGGIGGQQADFLISRLSKKINTARIVWGEEPNLTPERVRAHLSTWLQHRG